MSDECHQDFFLYSGQCFTSCPDRTFPSPTFTTGLLKPKTLGVGTVEPAMSSSLKKRRLAINMESFKNTVKPLENGKEYRPISNRNILKPQPPKYCIDCHYSCLTCSGPYVYQCVTCPGDAELVTSVKGVGKVNESYCYPSHIIPEIEDTLWLHRFYIMLGISLFAFFSVIVYFVLYRLMTGSKIFQKSRDSGTSTTIGYNRLGVVDISEKGVNIQKQISTAIFDNSDSDSEGV